MAQSSKPDPKRAPDPDRVLWYRSPAAMSAAGVAGLALVGALVFTVVTMSDQWSSPSAPTVLTTVVPTTQQTLRTTAPFIATPSSDSSSFPTSVQLSTTDIGIPGEETPTTVTPETSPGESSTSTDGTRSEDSDNDDEDETTTTRKRPRLNQTRTLSP